MLCYGIRVPDGARVEGVTAGGEPTTVLPGEYVVHLLQPKVHVGAPLVRFIGADPMCRDVHVPLHVARRYLVPSANDTRGMEEAAAA